MRRLLATAALLAALLAFIPRFVAAQPIWLYYDNVVKITQAQAFGSGYIVGDKHVQSVKHVVDPAETVWVWAGGKWSAGAVRCRDRETDSASLESEAADRGRPLTVAVIRPAIGEIITVAGWPTGLYTEQTLRVLIYEERIDIVGLGEVGPVVTFEYKGGKPGGMSGGPAINQHGEVFGSVTSWNPMGTLSAVLLDSQKCTTIVR